MCTTPVPTISASGPTSVCFPQSVTLSATPSYGVDFQWYKNGVAIAGATANYYGATTSGNYTVRIKDYCSTATSAPTNVTINTTITTSISAVGATTFCNGGSVTMNGTASGSVVSWQWYRNSIAISGATTSSYTATTAGTYHVIATGPCNSANSNYITTAVIATPTVSIAAGGATSFCTGGSVVLTGSTTGSVSGYQWLLNGGNISGAVFPSYTATTTGTYSLRISTTYCGNYTSNNIQVNAFAAVPAVPASITGAASFCAYAQGVPYSTAPVANATSYLWTLPTGATVATGQGTNSITVNFGNKAGNIKVQAINACGASAFRTKKVSKIQGCRTIGEGSEVSEIAFSVFPNPVSDQLNVKFYSETETAYSIQLLSVTGEVVYQFEQTATSDVNELSLDVSSLPTGMYMMVFEHEGETTYSKVVKQ